MDKIEITSFKAFSDTFVIEPLKKNILIYGDNGAGKSSIYDALKVIFFKDRLESELPTSFTPEEAEQNINDLWSSFNNRQTNTAFNLKINSTPIEDFNRIDYQVYMVSLPELSINKDLNLLQLIRHFYLDIQDELQFCNEAFEIIEHEVNSKLQIFHEDARISIDPQDGFAIKITDTKRSLETKAEIRKYFNEGKINLIILLTLFCTILLSVNQAKKKIIVLDDFITSLDIANRTFLIKYILDQFVNFQIFIFTHNITFYNLIKYTINNTNVKKPDNWSFANLYEINRNHKLFIKDNTDRVDTIRTAYDAVLTHPQDSIDQLGNNIRKKFEVLLYEFSKVLAVGGVEESKVILDRICNSNSYYAKPGGKNVYTLVDEIEGLIRDVPQHLLALRIRTKINSYKEYDLTHLKYILLELKLYQKVTMHPMSHGVNGLSSFTQKEIAECLELLSKLEGVLDKLTDSDVSSSV